MLLALLLFNFSDSLVGAWTFVSLLATLTSVVLYNASALASLAFQRRERTWFRRSGRKSRGLAGTADLALDAVRRFKNQESLPADRGRNGVDPWPMSMASCCRFRNARSTPISRCLAKPARSGRRMAPSSIAHGAGDDLNIKNMTGFPKMVKTKAGETVVFLPIVYKSRAHRDAVNKKVMKDERIAAMMDPKDMPFDVKRMAMGGFKVAIDL